MLPAYHHTGRYWTISLEQDSRVWVLVERQIPAWCPDTGLHLSDGPDPYSDPPTGRAHRWPHYRTAHGCKRGLQSRHGFLAAVYLYHDPRNGRPLKAWLY